jgi:hypothetical protein
MGQPIPTEGGHSHAEIAVMRGEMVATEERLRSEINAMRQDHAHEIETIRAEMAAAATVAVAVEAAESAADAADAAANEAAAVSDAAGGAAAEALEAALEEHEMAEDAPAPGDELEPPEIKETVPSQPKPKAEPKGWWGAYK